MLSPQGVSQLKLLSDEHPFKEKFDVLGLWPSDPTRGSQGEIAGSVLAA